MIALHEGFTDALYFSTRAIKVVAETDSLPHLGRICDVTSSPPRRSRTATRGATGQPYGAGGGAGVCE